MDKNAVRRWRRDTFRILKPMGWTPGPSMSAATVMIAVDAVGTDPTTLTELTGLSVEFVTRVLRRLRKSRLLVGQKMRVNWDAEGQDGFEGYVAIVADSLVAEGSVVRVPDEKRSAALTGRTWKRSGPARPRQQVPEGAVFTPQRVKADPLYLHADYAKPK